MTSNVKSQKLLHKFKNTIDSKFSYRVNQLIAEGKVKVYYSMNEFYARKKV